MEEAPLPFPRAVALIPARSGSKRLPGKNIHPLQGHPMIAYTIAGALESGMFAKVVVSTDSARIADIARHYGAEAPFLRPAAIAGEHSPDIEWVEDALRKLEAAGESFEIFSILRPTSPFRRAETICRAFGEFTAEKGVDSLRAVERSKQHPGKMWRVSGTRMTPLLPQDPARPMHSTPTVALPEVYAQNASLEIAYTRVVFEQHSIAGRVVMPFLTQGFEGVDLNDPYDLWYVEHLARTGAARLPEIKQPVFSISG